MSNSRRLFATFVGLCVMGGAGLASADPIATRQAIMWGNGAAGKVSGEMLKGAIPYNPDVAAVALASFRAASLAFREFFPEGTQTGGETRARDTIWTDRDGFIAANDRFAAAAAAAVAAKPADLEAFKAVFAPIGETCSSCHQDYRVARN